MTEYIAKEQVMIAMGDQNLMLDDIWGVEQRLDELPPADVVEVVRCWDCVNCLPESEGYMFQHSTGEKMGLYEIVEHRKKFVCRLYNMTVGPRFYCGSGERREDVMND